MIEWVGDMCRVWGRQKRRHLEGGFSYINEKGEEIRHVDGWPPVSIMGKYREERDGSSQGKREQHFPEGFTGEGLMVAVALIGMPEPQARALWMHYVPPKLPSKRRAQLCSQTVREYFDNLDRAHYWIMARLPPATQQEAEAG